METLRLTPQGDKGEKKGDKGEKKGDKGEKKGDNVGGHSKPLTLTF